MDVVDFLCTTGKSILKLCKVTFKVKSVYLGENVTPLGFFHFYQTSIDIVVVFLM